MHQIIMIAVLQHTLFQAVDRPQQIVFVEVAQQEVELDGLHESLRAYLGDLEVSLVRISTPSLPKGFVDQVRAVKDLTREHTPLMTVWLDPHVPAPIMLYLADFAGEQFFARSVGGLGPQRGFTQAIAVIIRAGAQALLRGQGFSMSPQAIAAISEPEEPVRAAVQNVEPTPPPEAPTQAVGIILAYGGGLYSPRPLWSDGLLLGVSYRSKELETRLEYRYEREIEATREFATTRLRLHPIRVGTHWHVGHESWSVAPGLGLLLRGVHQDTQSELSNIEPTADDWRWEGAVSLMMGGRIHLTAHMSVFLRVGIDYFLHKNRLVVKTLDGTRPLARVTAWEPHMDAGIALSLW